MIWKYRNSMVIHDTKCPHWDQMSLNNTNLTRPLPWSYRAGCGIKLNELIYNMRTLWLWQVPTGGRYVLFTCLYSLLLLFTTQNTRQLLSVAHWGDKVSMLTHIYPHKPWREIEVTICKITRLTAHFMCGLMSDLLICTCLLKIWSYMTQNVLTETRCH